MTASPSAIIRSFFLQGSALVLLMSLGIFSNTAALAATQPDSAYPAGSEIQSNSASASGQRAQLVAIRQALISSEISGKVVTVHFREGQRFKAGDVLVTYDSSLFKARYDRAVQAEAAAGSRLKVAKDLNALNSISTADYNQARSDLAVARAESRAERVLVDRCRILAPYDGMVGETFVRDAEHVSEGARLLTIYDDSAFEIETILPSRWLAWLKPGYPLSIAVDETGHSYEAKVKRIAGVVDPVSQSVKIVAVLQNAAQTESAPLMPGMSGMVHVTPPSGSGQ